MANESGWSNAPRKWEGKIASIKKDGKVTPPSALIYDEIGHWQPNPLSIGLPKYITGIGPYKEEREGSFTFTKSIDHPSLICGVPMKNKNIVLRVLEKMKNLIKKYKR